MEGVERKKKDERNRKDRLRRLKKTVGYQQKVRKEEIKKIIKKIRVSEKYVTWRSIVYHNHPKSCEKCGTEFYFRSESRICFKKPIAVILENNLKELNFESAMEVKELWDLELGLVLCEPCFCKFREQNRRKYK